MGALRAKHCEAGETPAIDNGQHATDECVQAYTILPKPASAVKPLGTSGFLADQFQGVHQNWIALFEFLGFGLDNDIGRKADSFPLFAVKRQNMRIAG